MAGSKEDAETVTAFFEDMKMRGLLEAAILSRPVASAITCALETNSLVVEAVEGLADAIAHRRTRAQGTAQPKTLRSPPPPPRAMAAVNKRLAQSSKTADVAKATKKRERQV
jgi:hypothetical protein